MGQMINDVAVDAIAWVFIIDVAVFAASRVFVTLSSYCITQKVMILSPKIVA
jgi:hypothetical protein